MAGAADGHVRSSPAFRVLFVCTGNVCRSALADRLGRAYLDEVLGDRAGEIQLTSAGTAAVVGSAMHPDTALVLAGLGGSPDGHVGRQLTAQVVQGAHLVLTMTRAQRDDVVFLAPRALNRTFTLLEAAAVLEALGEDLDLPGDDLAERARGLVARMAAARGRRPLRRDDDVPDPIGRPLAVQQQVGERVADAILQVLGRFAVLAGGPAGRTGQGG
ncbi:arsenate reductase/protein-tyrosine-phosphatase family protein [Modestobacter sp. SYSU DS0657]